MCNEVQYKVLDDEHFARWVYCPRFVDTDGTFNEKFISLRPQEEGISGQIFEKAGHDVILQCGSKFRRASNDGTAKEERFVGYVKALTGEIRKIADEPDTSIDVVYTSSPVPFHAEIRFYINEDLLKGNNQSPYYLRYRKKLTKLFEQDFFKIKSA
ncbi:MAG: hypothetical protein IKX43_07160 [Paludibacteraceae bacterium]|nr:hypothetical protein [Paludibacteraceae bacterium]